VRDLWLLPGEFVGHRSHVEDINPIGADLCEIPMKLGLLSRTSVANNGLLVGVRGAGRRLVVSKGRLRFRGFGGRGRR
jgi:hypothetical protein